MCTFTSVTALTRGGTARESGLGRPDLLVAESGLSIPRSFPEMSTWDGAEEEERAKGSHGENEERSLPVPPTHLPSEGTPGRPRAHGLWVIRIAGDGIEVGLQWMPMKFSSLKHHMCVPRVGSLPAPCPSAHSATVPRRPGSEARACTHRFPRAGGPAGMRSSQPSDAPTWVGT